MREWSEDPAFWEAMEPALTAPARLAHAAGDVAAVLVGTRPPANARVLDLGCGPGAHAIAFARAGFRVTGVDSSRRLLDRARAAARCEGATIEWVEADMRTFRRRASFDVVCSLNASFGFFDDNENRQVLDLVHASLAPGGVLVLDVIGREIAAGQGPAERRHEIGGVAYVERRRGDSDWTHLISDWIVVRERARSAFRVTLRLYSGAELLALLRSVGFAEVRIAGSLDGEHPYDESATRLVGLARVRSTPPESSTAPGTPAPSPAGRRARRARPSARRPS